MDYKYVIFLKEHFLYNLFFKELPQQGKGRKFKIILSNLNVLEGQFDS